MDHQQLFSYTPQHLAESILTSRCARVGERKQVTVLFCDLANSTALAEQLGPDAMHTLLNHFFTLALEAVHRYEGTLSFWKNWRERQTIPPTLQLAPCLARLPVY